LRELRRDLHVQLPGIAPEPLGDGRELFAAGGVAGAGVGDFVDRGDQGSSADPSGADARKFGQERIRERAEFGFEV